MSGNFEKSCIPEEKEGNDFYSYLEKADQSFETMDYDKCIKYCLNAIKIESDNALAYAKLSQAYYYINDTNLADEFSSKAIDLNKKCALAYYIKGRINQDNGDKNKAFEYYNKAITLDSNESDYYFSLAVLYANHFSDFDKALANYNKAIELRPNNADYYFLRASLYAYNFNEYINALDDSNKAIELNSNNGNFYFLRASLYVNHFNEFNKALVDINKSIDLISNNSYFYYFRANLYANHLNIFDKALDDLNKAIELNNSDAHFYYLRSCLNDDYSNDFDKSLDDINKAIELNPNEANFYSMRAGIFTNRFSDFKKALSDYNTAINITPNVAVLYYFRASLYLNHLNDYNSAFEDINVAIDLNPDDASFYYLRSSLYANYLNNYDNAFKDINKAINLNTNFSDFYCFRANLYAYHLNNLEKALEDSYKAIDLNNENPHAFYLLGNLYVEELEKYKEARPFFEKASEYGSKQQKFYLVRLSELKIQKIDSIISESIRENRNIKKLLDRIEESGLIKTVNETKESFKEFIGENSNIINKNDGLYILRRWNSYTPIIAKDNKISKGGGYFFKLNGKGIVIDPGFNFIDNFKSKGFKFCEIDHIFITHAHNDHTTDLESILTLLHEYNENILGDFDNPQENTIMAEVIESQKEKVTDEDREHIEKKAKQIFLNSNRRKHIKIYMSASTYTKYAPMLTLYKKSEYDIIILKPNDLVEFGDTDKEEIKVTAIEAKHNDLISDRDSLGFVVEYQNMLVIYTGDTGYDVNIENQYKNLKRRYRKKSIVLLAHFGGVKEYEKSFDASKDLNSNQKAFYKNHLGRLGLAKLIETLNPKICIISEFGEEFRKSRKKLTKIYQEIYKNTFFIPADIGLCLDTNNKINLIDYVNIEQKIIKKNFYDIKYAEVCEQQGDASLHYYNKEKIVDDKLSELIEYLSKNA